MIAYKKNEPDLVAQFCNPSTGEVEARGSRVQTHLWLHRKNEASLSNKNQELEPKYEVLGSLETYPHRIPSPSGHLLKSKQTNTRNQDIEN